MGVLLGMFLGVAAWPACGSGADTARPRPLSRQPMSPYGTEISGAWRWSLVTDEPGARRIEAERWRLEASDGVITGTYERTVTVESMDGVPFACNQALAYEQRARYQIEGDYDARGFRLRETGYEIDPSPCDSGHRALTRYRGEARGGRLQLRWGGGTQTLRPVSGSQTSTDVSQDATAPRGPGGSWRWQGRTVSPHDREVRVEREDWTLTEDASGVLTGSVVRTVTVFDENGQPFACSGDSHYRYQDRYRLRGLRQGARFTLTEIAVEADAHPCLMHRTRHLDAAVGEIIGEHLVLIWRGHRRQVLRRP